MESVTGTNGIIIPPEGYMQGVRALCDKYDVLMIADEVAVGFGRTGKMFACEHENVSPDLMCVAKGISGGYLPLAATLASQKIFDAFLGEPGAAPERQERRVHRVQGLPRVLAGR